MNKPLHNPTVPLLQRATLQTQANRYAFLRQTSDRKLINTIVNK